MLEGSNRQRLRWLLPGAIRRLEGDEACAGKRAVMKPQQDFSSGPIEESYRAQMNAIAKVLDEVFNGAARQWER